jgi:hypothetical protein
MVEGLIWLFSPTSGRIPPVIALERVTIKHFMLARWWLRPYFRDQP